LGGPDAVFVGGSLGVTPLVAGFNVQYGKIYILFGKNIGQSQTVSSGGYGVGLPGAAVGSDLTKFYYSGNNKQFNFYKFESFYGKGWEGSVGAGLYGLSGSVSFSYAPSVPQGRFVIGIGASFGIGTIGANINIFRTETKWE
jgi:hypothetical protein